MAIAAGDFYYLSTTDNTNTPTRFEEWFGFAADFSDSLNFNGDDAIVLLKDGSVVDAFGELAVDGTGEAWEHTNGWAYRIDGSSADTSFNIANWEFSGTDALNGETTNAGAVTPFPTGTYTSAGGTASSPSPPASPPPPPAAPLACTGIEYLQDAAVLGNFGDVYLACGWVTRIVYNGFFMQDEPTRRRRGLSTSASSSGIFVYTGSAPAGLSNGVPVEVKGELGEYNGLHQLTSSPVVTKPGGDTKLFSPVSIVVPVADASELDYLQGMLVSVTSATDYSLVVSEYFNLDRYGEFVACSAPTADGRLFQYTARQTPSVAGYDANVASNEKACFVVDDNISTQNPNPVLAGSVYAIDSANTLRGGSLVTALVGPLYINTGISSYWRVQPESASDLIFTPTITGARPSGPPDVPAADISIVSTNVLNYWVTVGADGNLRGADSAAEFERQAEKTTLALTQLDADVYGVCEIENLVGNGAAIDLVSRINAANPARIYAAVSVEVGLDTIGGDVIKVDVFYDTTKFSLAGYAVLEDSTVSDAILSQSTTGKIFDGSSRVPLAATLTSLESGLHVTIVMNHFKSKGGSGSGGDQDIGDGAGNYNQMRTLSAEAVLEWLATNPTGVATDNMLIMGDLNAYAKETPVTTLETGGFADVLTAGEHTYLYDGQFGSLDYVLAKQGTNVHGAAPWHVNSDEPDLIDYNLDYGRDVSLFDGTVPFRYSDHDPVFVTLWLGEPPNTNPNPIIQLFVTIFDFITSCF